MKTIQNLLFNKWLDFNYEIKNQILTNQHITIALLKFWNEIISKLENEQYIHIQFKIKLDNNLIRSISYIQTVKKEDYQLLLDSFISFWDIRSEDYHINIVSGIIFNYKLISKDFNIIESKINLHNKINLNKKATFKFGGFNLPTTMDINIWGNVYYKNSSLVIINKLNSKLEYHVSFFTNYNLIELKINDKILLKFKDIINDNNDLSTFTRIIKNQEYIFVNGKLKIKKIKRVTSFLTKVKKSIFKSDKFMTMDLETRTLYGIMLPYCISIYDGNIVSSFYITDYNNSDEMLEIAIKSVMRRKYNQYKIYLHNFSQFDSIFLLKILSNLSDNIKPIIRDGSIIDLKLKFNNYILYFRDSYLLLPSSLRKLATNFNVENKSIFPYNFVNDFNIDLNYEGNIPNYKYFNDITIEEYNEYCNSFLNKKWSLKFETIKYCNQDVISLYRNILFNK